MHSGVGKTAVEKLNLYNIRAFSLTGSTDQLTLGKAMFRMGMSFTVKEVYFFPPE